MLQAAADVTVPPFTSRFALLGHCASYETRQLALTCDDCVQVELFPRRCRGLANSIAYNIALAIFGGLVSLIQAAAASSSGGGGSSSSKQQQQQQAAASAAAAASSKQQQCQGAAVCLRAAAGTTHVHCFGEGIRQPAQRVRAAGWFVFACFIATPPPPGRAASVISAG